MNQDLRQSNQQFSWFRYALERRSASAAGMILLLVLATVGFAQAAPNGPVIVIIFAVVMYEFQKRMDQGVPLLQLTGLIAVLQWLVGPILNYSVDMTFGRYQMYVPETEYFSFAIPATALYVVLMLVTGASVKQKNLLQFINRDSFFDIGILLNIVAAVATVVAPRAGGGLAFLIHLMSQLRYVGALYFLFSHHRLRLILAGASCLQLFTYSLGSGMFHDLILWLAILFCYWFAQRHWSVPAKTMVLIMSIVGLFNIQVIKQEYRERLRRGEQPSFLDLTLAYITPGGRAWETDVLTLAITRLNQGWIISALMSNVPQNEPFAEGETVKEAVFSAILPRVVWSDKKTAGGRENFRRFTGLQIADSTSMGISPLGEAYANYGRDGGILFMLGYGTVFALIYFAVLRYALTHPTFIFWIPLIFYQAIKAETELLVVMNQLTKGGLVAFGCHYLLAQLFPLQMSAGITVSAPASTNPVSSPTPAETRESIRQVLVISADAQTGDSLSGYLQRHELACQVLGVQESVRSMLTDESADVIVFVGSGVPGDDIRERITFLERQTSIPVIALLTRSQIALLAGVNVSSQLRISEYPVSLLQVRGLIAEALGQPAFSPQ